MRRLSKEERKKAIEHNRKLGIIIGDTETENGGVKIEKLPTMDEQEGTFNHDDTDNFDIR